jgi:hypothetical protein
MVGQNPPLPRSYPAFRFATVVATLLFFFTFGFNALAPQLAQIPFGSGGGGGAEDQLFQSAPAATEAPAIAEAPAESAAGLAPQPTLMPPAEDAATLATATAGADLRRVLIESQLKAGAEAFPASPMIPRVWQILFAIVAVAGTVLMLLMRRTSVDRWR